MKKLRFKILIAVSVLALMLVTVFSINMFASEEYLRVTYVHDGKSYSDVCTVGGSVTLPTPEAKLGGEVFGWFDTDGNFYECGEAFTPSKSTTLYCAEGAEISLSGSFNRAVSKGYSYVKLNSSITLDETLNIKNGMLYIDLNGNNFALNTETDGFVGEDFGLVFANSSSKKSTLTHTAGGEAAFALNSLVSISPNTTANYLKYTIGENVALSENMNLISVKTNISSFDGALHLKLFGEVECGKIIRGNGLNNAVFEVFDGAKLTTDCEYFFEDIGTTAETAATLLVHGGRFYINGSTSYGVDTSIFKALIYGGSYSVNTTSFFKLGNYKSTVDPTTGLYKFSHCEHDGALIEHSPDCTSDVTLDHFCKYCETVFEKRYVGGVGHSYSPELTQEIVNTPEKTEPGCYTLTCTKCGYQTTQYTYPDPATVYVTVGFINEDGEEEYMRFPSTDLFSFNGTKILSFSADALYYEVESASGWVSEVHIEQKNVFHVEIPLGATEIYGDSRNSTPSGVFLRNDHLKSISFPVSLKNINKYAFSSMPNLETLIGIENVYGTISEYAFQQTAESKLVIENMKINASSIGTSAFRNIRMTTLTFTANVQSISQGAFGLDAGVLSNIAEIFIEDNTKQNGVALASAFSSLGRSCSSGQQFDGLRIVFLDHNYVAQTIPSTCIEYGYDLLTCDRCGYENKSNFTDSYAPHTYKPYTKPATCQAFGYEGEKCELCEHINVINDLYYDYNNHSYTFKEVKVALVEGTSTCVDPYYTLGQCLCGAVEPDTEENRSEVFQPDENATHKEKETIISPSTCGSAGVSRFDCVNCKQSRIDYPEPSGAHSWQYFITTPATCKTGSKGEAICAVCNERKETSSPTPDPNGHVKKEGDEGELVQEATTIHTGSRKYFCALCGYEFYEETPVLDKSEEKLPVGIIIAIIVGSVLGVLLLVGVAMTVIFTFKKKNNTSRGYKFKLNTLKNGSDTGSGKTIQEQLAEMHILNNEPEETIDHSANFSAYMAAISQGNDATAELKVTETDDISDSERDASLQAYFEALKQDYTNTQEAPSDSGKSLAEMMDDSSPKF
ncbi:MAG: leucine-rich repeat protein [Clostridia bacterium]|nr:leucine-rich repeat protein [Clostridia bacterium]